MARYTCKGGQWDDHDLHRVTIRVQRNGALLFHGTVVVLLMDGSPDEHLHVGP